MSCFDGGQDGQQEKPCNGCNAENVTLFVTNWMPVGLTTDGETKPLAVVVPMSPAQFARLMAEMARECELAPLMAAQSMGEWASDFVSEALDRREEVRVNCRREEARQLARADCVDRGAALLAAMLRKAQGKPLADEDEPTAEEAAAVFAALIQTL